MQLILLYSLKDGVSPKDFEHFVKTIDYPGMRGLERVKSFKTYRCEKLLMGEGAPSVQYAEVFDVPDLDGFLTEDMPCKTVQNIMGQFMGFADAPEFIIASEV